MPDKTEKYVAVEADFGGLPGPGPAPGELHIYREDGAPQMVDLQCPCGCGRLLPTPVMPLAEKQAKEAAGEEDSRWGFDPETLTLYPSIRWMGGCKTHFSIKGGAVEWHPF